MLPTLTIPSAAPPPQRGSEAANSPAAEGEGGDAFADALQRAQGEPKATASNESRSKTSKSADAHARPTHQAQAKSPAHEAAQPSTNDAECERRCLARRGRRVECRRRRDRRTRDSRRGSNNRARVAADRHRRDDGAASSHRDRPQRAGARARRRGSRFGRRRPGTTRPRECARRYCSTTGARAIDARPRGAAERIRHGARHRSERDSATRRARARGGRCRLDEDGESANAGVRSASRRAVGHAAWPQPCWSAR